MSSNQVPPLKSYAMIIRIILTVHTCQAVIMREDFLLSFWEKRRLWKQCWFLNGYLKFYKLVKKANSQNEERWNPLLSIHILEFFYKTAVKHQSAPLPSHAL